MQLTLGMIADLVDGGTLTKLDEGVGIPWKCRFACSRLVGAVLVEYRRFAKLRETAVRQFGVEEDGRISVAHPKNTPEKITAFNDALIALLETKIELDVKPLSLTELGGETCPLALTPKDIRLLGALLVE